MRRKIGFVYGNRSELYFVESVLEYLRERINLFFVSLKSKL